MSDKEYDYNISDLKNSLNAAKLAVDSVPKVNISELIKGIQFPDFDKLIPRFDFEQTTKAIEVSKKLSSILKNYSLATSMVTEPVRQLMIRILEETNYAARIAASTNLTYQNDFQDEVYCDNLETDVLTKELYTVLDEVTGKVQNEETGTESIRRKQLTLSEVLHILEILTTLLGFVINAMSGQNGNTYIENQYNIQVTLDDGDEIDRLNHKVNDLNEQIKELNTK